jgi:hypothetical protein
VFAPLLPYVLAQLLLYVPVLPLLFPESQQLLPFLIFLLQLLPSLEFQQQLPFQLPQRP